MLHTKNAKLKYNYQFLNKLMLNNDQSTHQIGIFISD